MSKYFALLLLVVGLLGTAAASYAGPDEGRKSHSHHGDHGMMMGEFGDPDRMLAHMQRRLELDEDQALKIGNVLSAVDPESSALRERGMAVRESIAELDAGDKDYHARLQDLALESGEVATSMVMLLGRVRAELYAELTDEQRQKLASGRGHWRERMGGRHERSRDESAASE